MKTKGITKSKKALTVLFGSVCLMCSVASCSDDPDPYRGQIANYNLENEGVIETDDYLAISSNPISGNNEYTINIWVKNFNEGVLYHTVYGNYVGAPTIALDGSTFQVATAASNTAQFYSTGASTGGLRDDEWHMITVSASKYGDNNKPTLYVYVDGRKRRSYSTNGVVSRGESIHIGCSCHQLTNSGHRWLREKPMTAGKLGIYGVCLKDDEVAALFEKESSIINSNE